MYFDYLSFQNWSVLYFFLSSAKTHCNFCNLFLLADQSLWNTKSLQLLSIMYSFTVIYPGWIVIFLQKLCWAAKPLCHEYNNIHKFISITKWNYNCFFWYFVWKCSLFFLHTNIAWMVHIVWFKCMKFWGSYIKHPILCNVVLFKLNLGSFIMHAAIYTMNSGV